MCSVFFKYLHAAHVGSRASGATPLIRLFYDQIIYRDAFLVCDVGCSESFQKNVSTALLEIKMTRMILESRIISLRILREGREEDQSRSVIVK